MQVFKKYSKSNLIWNSWLTEKAVLYVWLPFTRSYFPISQNLDHFWTGVGNWPHVHVNLTKLIFGWLEIFFFFCDYFPLLQLNHRLTFKKLKTSRNLVLIHLNCFVYGPFLCLPWPCSLVLITAASFSS